MKIWVHLLEREINLLGRPRTGAKDHAGNFSERKQTKQTCFHTVHKKFMPVREL